MSHYYLVWNLIFSVIKKEGVITKKMSYFFNLLGKLLVENKVIFWSNYILHRDYVLPGHSAGILIQKLFEFDKETCNEADV